MKKGNRYTNGGTCARTCSASTGKKYDEIDSAGEDERREAMGENRNGASRQELSEKKRETQPGREQEEGARNSRIETAPELDDPRDPNDQEAGKGPQNNENEGNRNKNKGHSRIRKRRIESPAK